MKKFLAIVVAIILVAGLGVGAYFLFFRVDKEPNSTMTISVNPEIQFVLNKDNKVLYANATNTDGEKLLATVDFSGKSADEAAKMFVEISTQSSYISLDTTGTTVTININCEEETEKLKELKTRVQNKVNGYFQEIGVVAGAVVNIGTDILSDLDAIGTDVSNLADKSYAELMENLKESSNQIEDVALSLRDGLLAKIDAVREQLNMISLEDTIDSTKAQINKIKQQINDSQYLSEATKEVLNGQIQTLEKELDEAEKNFANVKKEFNKQVDELIEEAKKQSEEIFKTAKEFLNNKITETKALIDAHKENYNTNKTEILKQIEDFQNSLVTA